MENTELNALNAWQSQLLNYISEYHPYMLKNDDLSDMIVLRAKAAQEEYQRSFLNGLPAYEAVEKANQRLYADLHFSPTAYLNEIATLNLNKELDTKQLVLLYEYTKNIFDKYEVSDDFLGSDNETALTEELLPYVEKYCL